MDYLKKTIFTTIWDYEQAGILDPTIYKDKLLLTNFFKSNAIKSSEKKIDHKNLEYQIDKKIINQQYYSSDNTNQNLIDNNLILEVENLADSSKDIPSLENNITNFKKFHSLKLNVEFHSEDIEENLKKIASSKYFIKLKGRKVRGNSFLEAMSASSLCLLNYNDCFGKIPFHQYCYFKDEEHLIEKLKFLEKNNEFLIELLKYQELILQNMIENVKIQFETDLYNKRKNLESKRSRINPKKINIKSIFKKSLQPIIVSSCWNSLVRIDDPVIDKTKYLPPILE